MWLTPDTWRLLRDVLLACTGVAMLIHETLSPDPSPLIVGAALTLLGLPAALRYDQWRNS